MSSKLSYIPLLKDYSDVRDEMNKDLKYRLRYRTKSTSLGRPLYQRINTQLILTEECPYNCDFCLERKNPMSGENNFEAQIEALKTVILEHPNTRLTITGGEPGLYPKQVQAITTFYKDFSNRVFCSVNTAGYSTELNGMAHINLSVNEFVHEDPRKFPNCTVQTIITNPTVEQIKCFMSRTEAQNFSFRFLSDINKKDYPVNLWNELEDDKEITVNTFRIGDFFVYATFNYNGKHGRVTLGDMWQQQHNNYQDGYSNIIIHPDGTIRTNWR